MDNEDEMIVMVASNDVSAGNRSDQDVIDQLIAFTKNPNGDPRIDSNNAQAIKSLIRRLRRKHNDRGAIDNLFRAIKEKDPETACVRLPRSLDGRMQVRQKKVVPHVYYFQTFRSTGCRSYHDLQAILSCRYSYATSLQTGEVCINPYHYELRSVDRGRRTLSENSIEYTSDSSSPMDCQNPAQGYELTPVEDASGYYTQTDEDNANGLDLRNRLCSQTTPDEQYNIANVGRAKGGNMIEFTTLSSPDRVLTGTHAQTVSRQLEARMKNNQKQPWISINYYEKGQRVGDEFVGCNSVIAVDGGCHPWNPQRFCIGRMSNIHRDPQTINLRCHIGDGILIELQNNEVYLKNRCKYSVFVQSLNWNVRDNQELGIVKKVPSGSSAVIFCHLDFAERLQACVNNLSFDAGYQSVCEMGTMLTVRISFIKGWGPSYKRNRVTTCPCWIEVKFQIGLSWLDHVITELESPLDGVPTSTS